MKRILINFKKELREKLNKEKELTGASVNWIVNKAVENYFMNKDFKILVKNKEKK